MLALRFQIYFLRNLINTFFFKPGIPSDSKMAAIKIAFVNLSKDFGTINIFHAFADKYPQGCYI